LAAVPEQSRLEVDVGKAVRAPVAPSFVRGVLQQAVRLRELEARLPAGTWVLAVRLTGDRQLRRLNRMYAGDDSVTDVLSFAGSGQHIGDLAISWPAVVRQAHQFGEQESAELALLCVHGLLHLLGWDHQSPRERREMSRLTRAALKRSKLAVVPGRL
jgi:probable rRNA maturation factor